MNLKHFIIFYVFGLTKIILCSFLNDFMVSNMQEEVEHCMSTSAAKCVELVMYPFFSMNMNINVYKMTQLSSI